MLQSSLHKQSGVASSDDLAASERFFASVDPEDQCSQESAKYALKRKEIYIYIYKKIISIIQLDSYQLNMNYTFNIYRTYFPQMSSLMKL